MLSGGVASAAYAYVNENKKSINEDSSVSPSERDDGGWLPIRTFELSEAAMLHGLWH